VPHGESQAGRDRRAPAHVVERGAGVVDHVVEEVSSLQQHLRRLPDLDETHGVSD
jgi:hypothetical protein